jgi:hypothetical protein
MTIASKMGIAVAPLWRFAPAQQHQRDMQDAAQLNRRRRHQIKIVLRVAVKLSADLGGLGGNVSSRHAGDGNGAVDCHRANLHWRQGLGMRCAASEQSGSDKG